MPKQNPLNSAETKDCTCTLCRRRAGEVVTPIEVTFEEPKVRKPGEPCECRHCEALRKENQ